MRDEPMPLRVVAVCAVVGVIGGAILGFVRGIGYVPTLPFAILEGALVLGVPASLFGLLVAGVCWAVMSVRRRLL